MHFVSSLLVACSLLGEIPRHLEMEKSQNYPSASREHDCGSETEKSVITTRCLSFLLRCCFGNFPVVRFIFYILTISHPKLLLITCISLSLSVSLSLSLYISVSYCHASTTQIDTSVSKHGLFLAYRGCRDFCTTQIPSTPSR